LANAARHIAEERGRLSSAGTPFAESVADPAAGPAALLGSVAAVGLQCALGALAGLAIARLTRLANLHWSWAALALALLVLASRTPLGFSPAVLAAALAAAVSSSRSHRRDRRVGGDLAQAAALRIRPHDVLWRISRLILAPHEQGTGPRLAIGRDGRGRPVSIPFGPSSAVHTLVVGATGSGKTVTQTLLATGAVARGMGVIALDPKGDPALGGALRRAAALAGRSFLAWTPSGGCVYNPFASGGESEIADKALAGERFTEPHYQRQAQRYLGHVVRSLRASGTTVSLRALARHMDPERLEDLARALAGEAAQETHGYLAELTPRQRSDLAGARDRLAILAESDVGRWLDPDAGGAEHLDLLAAVRARAVVYIDLQADSRPLLMQMLAGAIVQDLQTTAAALQTQPIPTLALIDEFSAVASEQVVRLFGRARSAGMSVVLGTQELSDLRPAGQERMLERVLGNLSVLIAHRQGVPESAEMIARMAGTSGTWRISSRSDGGEMRTRTREGVLEESAVMYLRQGWAAVIELGSGSARLTRVRRPPDLR
jgi:hypothetical protein